MRRCACQRCRKVAADGGSTGVTSAVDPAGLVGGLARPFHYFNYYAQYLTLILAMFFSLVFTLTLRVLFSMTSEFSCLPWPSPLPRLLACGTSGRSRASSSPSRPCCSCGSCSVFALVCCSCFMFLQLRLYDLTVDILRSTRSS